MSPPARSEAVAAPSLPASDQLGAIAIAVVATLAVGYLVGSDGYAIAAALLAGVGAMAFGIAAPVAFVSGFLFIRPLLDSYNASEVSIGGLPVNAASALGFIAIGVAIGTLARTRLDRGIPAAVPFCAVFVLSALGAAMSYGDLGSDVGSDAIAELVRLLALFAIFVIAATQIRGVAGVRRLFVVAGLAAVVPALIGLYQLAAGHVPISEGLTLARIEGPFTGPNPYGMYLAVAALILVGLPRSDLRMDIRLMALVPVLAALTATYSRTGWGMFLVGVLILVGRRHQLMVPIALVGVVAVALAIPGVRERFVPGGGTPDTPGATSVDTTSYKWRIDTWRYVLEKYTESPIVGFGLSSASFVNPRQTVLPGTINLVGYDVHNMALRILLEGGVVLSLAYLWLAVRLARGLLAARKPGSDVADYSWLLLVLWGVVILAGFSADDPLQATAMMYVMLALTGGVLGAFAKRSPRPAAATTNSLDGT